MEIRQALSLRVFIRHEHVLFGVRWEIMNAIPKCWNYDRLYIIIYGCTERAGVHFKTYRYLYSVRSCCVRQFLRRPCTREITIISGSWNWTLIDETNRRNRFHSSRHLQTHMQEDTLLISRVTLSFWETSKLTKRSQDIGNHAAVTQRYVVWNDCFSFYFINRSVKPL